MTRDTAKAPGMSERMSTHLSDGTSLPLANGSLDRISMRNVLMYVDDPVATSREFFRVLKSGGRVHAIEGDWYMMVVDPVGTDLWHAFVRAASIACRHADMGRRLHRVFREAGFESIEVQVDVEPDVDGRLMGMIRNMGRYAEPAGSITATDIGQVVDSAEAALVDGSYLALAPRFVVTGQKPAGRGNFMPKQETG